MKRLWYHAAWLGVLLAVVGLAMVCVGNGPVGEMPPRQRALSKLFSQLIGVIAFVWILGLVAEGAAYFKAWWHKRRH